MQSSSAVVLRAAVVAAVLTVGLGVTHAQAYDIARRIIAADQPTITTDGGIRLAAGETLTDALERHKQAAPHLFETAAQANADADATRAKLKALKPADRLEAINNAQGVTGAWVNEFCKGRPQ